MTEQPDARIVTVSGDVSVRLIPGGQERYEVSIVLTPEPVLRAGDILRVRLLGEEGFATVAVKVTSDD